MKNYTTNLSQNEPNPDASIGVLRRRNKKVVILSDQPKDRISGPNIVILNLFPFLEKELDIKWKVCPGLNIFGFKTVPPSIKSILSSLISFSKLLFDKDIREAEIINAHGISSWLPAIWLAKFLGKTSLITFHEIYEYTKLKWFFGGGKIARRVWNYTTKNADYIIDVSGTQKNKNVFYIPNGINIGMFKPKQAKKREKTVLIVCRLSPEKGIEYFVEASRIIRKRLDAKFVAVVNSPVSARKNNLYMDLLNNNGIEIHRQIPPDEMQRFYGEADVLILPSLMEAFPLVIFEAMACGTPVVAADVGGVARAVKDNVVGFLVPPKDSQAIAEKTIKILENENLRLKMSHDCIEWTKEFTWDKIAEKYLEVYRKIFSGQAGRK